MPIYIFYKIFCKDENIKDLYVGKTTDLRNRWYSHKDSCNNENNNRYNLKLYQFIRENGEWNNWNIIEIDKGEYDDKDSAIRERYWIEELNANLNTQIPSRTRKEWREEHRNEQINYLKIYYQENKEKFIEYRNQEEFKEKKRNCDKKYRDKNKEELYKKASERLICEICGKTFRKGDKSQHYKTMFHQKYIIDEKK